MRLVYQLELFDVYVYIIKCLFPTLMIVLALIFFRMAKKYNKNLDPIFLKIFSVTFLAILGIVQIATIFGCKEAIGNVYLAYKSGDYESVYGDVISFHTDSSTDTFEIDGVEFFYSNRFIMMGYNKNEGNGGYIHEDSKNIRIDYIPYKGDNRIVAIYEGE